MANETPLKLSIGDRVVYPNQGLCRVTSVAAKEVAGQKLTFVSLRREEDGAVVMVPQQKILAIGVRKVSSPNDVRQIFAFLQSDTDRANLDWKQRARTNLDRMSTGGLLGLAEVVKGLQVLSELRPLPTKERELYDTARHLLASEIAASLDIAEYDAEDAIDLILFPPGRERPKRTAEEFQPTGDGESSDLDSDLDAELMDLDSALELPGDEALLESTSKATSKSKSAVPVVPKKRGRPPKPKPVVTGPPKKRGRPPKPKPAVTGPPKKRGRPPKAKPTTRVSTSASKKPVKTGAKSRGAVKKNKKKRS
ncbi:MAG: CarD family transcriptional regulator [Myxococcaceae bacterium]